MSSSCYLAIKNTSAQGCIGRQAKGGKADLVKTFLQCKEKKICDNISKFGEFVKIWHIFRTVLTNECCSDSTRMPSYDKTMHSVTSYRCWKLCFKDPKM